MAYTRVHGPVRGRRKVTKPVVTTRSPKRGSGLAKRKVGGPVVRQNVKKASTGLRVGIGKAIAKPVKTPVSRVVKKARRKVGGYGRRR